MDTEARRQAQAFVEKLPGRAGRPCDPSTRASRDETKRQERALIRTEFAGAGFDMERLDGLAAERSKAHKQVLEQAHRRAVDASAAAAGRLAELTPAADALPAEPMNVILDQVTFIRSFLDAGVVTDSDIGSLDNWARYKLNVAGGGLGERGVGRLSFFTLWRNPENRQVVVAAGARLVVNAHLSLDAEWLGAAAWFGINGGADVRATVRARTTVWAMWDSRISAIVHDRVLAEAGAKGGFFGDGEEASIEFNEFLAASGFLVPAHASILIEVELLTEWFAENGSVHLDGESGAFRISVPHLVLTLT